MPIKVDVDFLTPNWRLQSRSVEEAIRRLEPLCPRDETPRVLVYEIAEDAPVHATIVQRQRSLSWNDWEISSGEPEGTALYQKSFGPPDPSVEDVVESIRRVVRASGNRL
jgi:hypothetical protein